jgi:hypothetical protein
LGAQSGVKPGLTSNKKDGSHMAPGLSRWFWVLWLFPGKMRRHSQILLSDYFEKDLETCLFMQK